MNRTVKLQLKLQKFSFIFSFLVFFGCHLRFVVDFHVSFQRPALVECRVADFAHEWPEIK